MVPPIWSWCCRSPLTTRSSLSIAHQLGVHPDTVRKAIEAERFHSIQPLRSSIVDPYVPFLRQTLEQYPDLRATRLYLMIRDRGYRKPREPPPG
jgi:ribosomal 50S subunit-associated protein YjgA (DUF615 family)